MNCEYFLVGYSTQILYESVKQRKIVLDDEVKQLPQQATLLGTLVGLYKYQTGNLNF